MNVQFSDNSIETVTCTCKIPRDSGELVKVFSTDERMFWLVSDVKILGFKK